MADSPIEAMSRGSTGSSVSNPKLDVPLDLVEAGPRRFDSDVEKSHVPW